MEKGTSMTTTTERPAKVIGAYKHLMLELQKVNLINDIDREHLIREYVRGKIMNFGHLAEYLRVTINLNDHNVNQIVNYGKRYGEN